MTRHYATTSATMDVSKHELVEEEASAAEVVEWAVVQSATGSSGTYLLAALAGVNTAAAVVHRLVERESFAPVLGIAVDCWGCSLVVQDKAQAARRVCRLRDCGALSAWLWSS